MDLNQAGLQRLKSLTINKKPHGLNTGEVFKTIVQNSTLL